MRRRAPPWWPANEPWPAAHRWSRGQSRFMRRAGCAFAVMLVLSSIGVMTLISLATRRIGEVSSIAMIVAAIVILALAVFLTVIRRFGFPLGDIVAAADRVGAGDYSTRIVEHGPRSLRSVARAFNSMTQRLHANEELRRNLMADIAHELRTPLSVMQGRLEALVDGVYPRDDARLQEVLEETRVLARLVEDLRTLANAESGALTLRKERSDLSVLVHEVVSSLSPEAAAGGITLRVESTDMPLIDIDPLRIREVLINLLSNAIRHSDKGGKVSVTAEERDAGVVVRVRDEGSGISAEELPKIFDRFYKGSTSHGSGLGLTIARNLVEAHGGHIRAESVAGAGTTVSFTLPLGE
jgi:signal transduction histidine kinase